MNKREEELKQQIKDIENTELLTKKEKKQMKAETLKAIEKLNTIQQLKNKNEKRKREKIQKARKSYTEDRKEEFYRINHWTNQKPSMRILKLIIDLGKLDSTGDRVQWIKQNVKTFDSYNLKKIFKKIDELE